MYGHIRNRSIAIAGTVLTLLFHSRSTNTIRPDEYLADIKAIAVLKPCCLGDVLMSTPMIGALRAAFPSARIDFFVGNWSKQMIIGNPKIDNTVDIGTVGSGRFGLGDYLAVARQLRRGRYDACFILDRSAFITSLPFLAGIPRRIGLDSQGRGFSLTTAVPCVEIKHEAELYLDAVRAIGIAPKNPRLEFHPTPGDFEKADRILAPLTIDPSPLIPPASSKRPPIIVIHPGGGSNPGMDLLAKRWPAERFAAVTDTAIAEFDATVLVVGGQGDIALSRQIFDTSSRKAIDLVGQTTLGELAAICERSDLFVGNDTGPMHLAAAVGTTVIAIFGPTDERVYGPFSADSTTIAGRASCRPCFRNGAAPLCASTECITSVTVDEVWRAARDKLLAKGFQANGTGTKCLV